WQSVPRPSPGRPGGPPPRQTAHFSSASFLPNSPASTRPRTNANALTPAPAKNIMKSRRVSPRPDFAGGSGTSSTSNVSAAGAAAGGATGGGGGRFLPRSLRCFDLPSPERPFGLGLAASFGGMTTGMVAVGGLPDGVTGFAIGTVTCGVVGGNGGGDWR